MSCYDEGNSFLVLDEQRFAKEILPKFFKHNNMASFVRQLNMYGFRKVMHIDTGIVKQERDGPVEFQHPYFKHGQDDLLENIKRKVSNARPEESKIRQDDLSKILTSVQNVHEQQENMDARLATLKRENEALWTELSDLRQKHSQQQQVIKELVQFIFTLVQNNRMLNLKRKRPLTLNSNGKKSKFIHQIFEEPMDHSKSAVNGLNGLKNSSDISEDVVFCDITEEDAEFTDGVSVPADQGDAEIVEVACESSPTIRNDSTNETGTNSTTQQEAVPKIISDISSSTLQLNKPSALSSEDPVKLMNSILSENGAISQNINLLGKVELMDYLDSIDCSLEDFQAMLYGKQFSIDPDIIQQAVSETKDSIHKGEPDNKDKQLIQYTTCPLLAFIDGCTPLAPPDSPTENLSQPILPQSPENFTDLLDKDLETETPRSSLIRLEPLTEAEASETTLFCLCDLNSDLPSDDTPQLDF
ncbi:heat shock factor protein 2-like isoform X2 [Sinocyclocheilus anshuiensis]|uniref:heat shock factor protein 2-like isoform X2 n=1 Tax=Sinocyclocheilus anshuiensis TaxID=1608454 RepID=UPI0007B83FB6|nr:PREDICTED: heat shock factor protein 2-like isoform X2 [Sinocyclocheilus anshuiensis]